MSTKYACLMVTLEWTAIRSNKIKQAEAELGQAHVLIIVQDLIINK